MADEKTNREADRKVATGGANQTDDDVDPYTLMPGVVGRGSTVLPNSGRDDESSAARAEGTIGAAGEMDLTGRPAGTGGAASMSGAGGASGTGGEGGSDAAPDSALTGSPKNR